MQIQNFDPGMSFLRPMATAQEMDIRLAQEGRAKEQQPLEMKRLAALTEWDVTRAAEKRSEMESDANLARYLQDYKPSKEGLPYEEQLGEMSAGLIRQGKVNEAKKLADLSVGMENVRAMAEQRKATAEMRQVRAQKDQYTMWNQTLSAINEGNVGDVLARVKQQGMPEEDLAQFTKMAQTPQGRETIRNIARSWEDTIRAEQRGESLQALKDYRTEVGKRAERALALQQQGLNIRSNLAKLAAVRTEAYVKAAGKNAPEASTLDIKQAQALIASDEDLMDSVDMTREEAFAFASAVAERAKTIKLNSKGALSGDEALAKAKDEVSAQLVKKPDGTVTTWMNQVFGKEPTPKATYKGPPKTPAPAAGGLPPGSKLIGVAKGTTRRVWQTPDGKKIVED